MQEIAVARRALAVGGLRQRMPGRLQRDPEETWIFGFGSIIYKQGFEYQRRVDGYIRGWRRVWYQGSTDHRGTEDAPGRVVTIVPDANGVVWGSAFLLTGDVDEQKAHLQELEHREKQYDGREYLDIYTGESDKEPALTHCLTFIATNKKANKQWLGPASLESVAQQIAYATGPSGQNCQYLYYLADALRKANVKEPELYELCDRVREIRQAIDSADDGHKAEMQQQLAEPHAASQ